MIPERLLLSSASEINILFPVILFEQCFPTLTATALLSSIPVEASWTTVGSIDRSISLLRATEMAATSSVTVALRIKPTDSEDMAGRGCLEVSESSDGQKAVVTVKGKAGALSEFVFDTVFMDSLPPKRSEQPTSAVLPNTQRDVFVKIAKPLCRAVLQGMHASILAYGQTGLHQRRQHYT